METVTEPCSDGDESMNNANESWSGQ